VIVIVIVIMIVSLEAQTAASAVDSTASPWNVSPHRSKSSFSPPPDYQYEKDVVKKHNIYFQHVDHCSSFVDKLIV